MLRVFYPFMGDTVGGSHLSDLEIISRLPSQDFKPVIGLHISGGLLEQYLPVDKEIHNFHQIMVPENFRDFIKSPIRFLTSIYKARNFLRSNRIDIVHCNDGPLRYIWFYAALFSRTKFIIMQRGFSNCNWEKKFSYKRVDGIICNSHFTSENLPARPSNGRIAVSYPPVKGNPDILEKKSFFEKRLKEELGVSDHVRLIGYVANMRKWKKPETFIETAYQLQKRHPAPRCFVLLGAFYSDYEERLKSMVKQKNLENNVFFLGFKSNNLEYLAGFDMIIATAIDEPFGRVLVEAMNLNVPVIASYSGGHKEIVNNGKTGFFAEPDNAVDFARQVTLLENNEILRKDIIQEAGDVSSRKFAPQTQMEIISNFYKKI